MNRREFSVMLTGAAAFAVLPRRLPAEQEVANLPSVSEQAAKLYRSALTLDCNCAPPVQETLPLPQSDLDMCRNSGVNIIKFSLAGINESFADTVVELHPAYFIQVRVPGDLRRAKAEGKMGIILSFESTDMLEGKVERLELFRNLGVRVMQLSYNRKSPFAAGVMEPNGGGLTQLGHNAVKKMNELGIAVDLSHSNAQTTADAISASSKPVIMSHAGCSAIYLHPRNKTDEQLRALADKGGVMGIYDLPYLTAPPKQPTVDDYIAHMEHALKIMGEDHVGVGSDASIAPFDTSPKGMAEFEKHEKMRQESGLAAPEEGRPTYVVGLNIPRRIEMITDQLLKRGYSTSVAEKVIGANFAKVLTDIWT
jgi:membrane dipeptidase